MNSNTFLKKIVVLTKTIKLLAITGILLYTSKAYTQTIDLNKPVGSIAGQSGVSANGAGTYTIPIEIIPGTGGMQPEISLSYNSQSGWGNAGFGWNCVPYSVISRSGKKMFYDNENSAVNYTNTNDRFLIDGTRLQVINGNNGANGTTYQTEGMNFGLMESFGGSETTGPDWFKVTTRDGIVLEYGNTADSKFYTENGTTVMFWLLKRKTDRNGNYLQYNYSINGTYRNFQLTEIVYTGNAGTGLQPYNTVSFTYENKQYPYNHRKFDGGASVISNSILKTITVSGNGEGYQVHTLNYETVKGVNLLKTITKTDKYGNALNPLVFEYGNNKNAANFTLGITNPARNTNLLIPAELTGDGKTDIINVNGVYQNSNFQYCSSYDVYSNQFSNLEYSYTIPVSSGLPYFYQQEYQNMLTTDFDNDTKNDVVILHYEPVMPDPNNVNNILIARLKEIRINYSKSYLTGNNVHSSVITNIPTPNVFIHENRQCFFPGDFNGDGIQDYILILADASGAYNGFFSCPLKNIFNVQIGSFTEAGNVAGAHFTMPIDLNGDGKTELLYQNSGTNNLQIISLNFSTNISSPVITANTPVTVFSGWGKVRLFPGDFNGDGKIDLLMRKNYTSPSYPWEIYYGQGDFSFQVTSFAFSGSAPTLFGDNNDLGDNVIVADFNRDGKTDILHAKKLTGTNTENIFYYFNGITDNFGYGNPNYTTETINYDPWTSIFRSTNQQPVYGDYNGDGVLDVLSVNSTSNYSTFVFPFAFKDEYLLTKATNGFDATETFTYTNQLERSATYQTDLVMAPLFTQENGKYFNVLKAPFYTANNHAGLDGNSTTYSFKDMAYHVEKGLLGFLESSATHAASLTISTTKTTIDAAYLLPATVISETFINGTKTASAKNTTGYINYAGNGRNYYRYRPVAVTAYGYNHIAGSGVKEDNTFESGNITAKTITKGYIYSTDQVYPQEQTQTSLTYGTYGTPVPALPVHLPLLLPVGQLLPQGRYITATIQKAG